MIDNTIFDVDFYPEIDLYDKFMSNVDKKEEDECWIWIGKKTKNGYGAYRLSYVLFKGELKKGMCICHKCNNKGCVNPNHLYQGTQQDNINDLNLAYLNGKKRKKHIGYKFNRYVPKQHSMDLRIVMRKRKGKQY